MENVCSSEIDFTCLVLQPGCIYLIVDGRPPPALLLPFESQQKSFIVVVEFYNSITSCHAGQVNAIVTQRREIDQFNEWNIIQRLMSVNLKMASILKMGYFVTDFAGRSISAFIRDDRVSSVL
ncbi:hypothetical protein DAPPUDRAFT_232907 [Daphnia pulex]|uniref:Uncharacterized protein n=1 Tax=Daphnia pulex TaxID=6669 RepID=E9FSN8_DAPPU|nr:hypothetical protein DAPPUDRAFT_232907 [Daphnia pulex]|eukprot:EFX89792.1 hypothetical protein DAPPUDRAFT_232907 [Daphnia pulex]